MKFRSFADYWEPFLVGQGPAGAYVRRLGSARQEDLRREVRRLLGVVEEERPLTLQARAWAVRGRVGRLG